MHEIDQIRNEFNLDVGALRDLSAPMRVTHLELARDKLVRGQILSWFTFVDEFLACEICWFYFGRTRRFPSLWRTARFRLFNYHILQPMPTLQKLRHVQALRSLPKPIVKDIERLSSLRNYIAHNLFPENTRGGAPQWKGTRVFSLDGLRAIQKDFEVLHAFFMATAPKWFRYPE